MDQKHAMLYPELQPGSTVPDNQRALAIGLPTTNEQNEPPPPSYDIAISAATTQNPIATSPNANDNNNWYHNSAFQAAVSPNTTPSNFVRNEVISRSFGDSMQPQFHQTLPPPVGVINQQHISKLGPHPCTVFCPACGAPRSTKMAYTANTRTHFCALLLCLVGWCCCACLVPYCTNSCQTGNHYCTACNTFLGTYKPQDIP